MNQKRPTRETIEGRVYLDLQNAARRASRDTAEYLALYALECFLARLASSSYADDFVLKGGVLLAAFASRRPTRDIDFRAGGFPSTIDDVVDRARAIAASSLDDGLVFDLDGIHGNTIREEEAAAGVRVNISCSLFSANVAFHLDVNFGDPIWPEPTMTKLPLLLGGELQLLGYPIHMVLAEKIVTAISRGAANTRWRDFVDIAAIIAGNVIDGSDLKSALTIVAEHRKVPVVPLATVLDGMASLAQRRWAAWRKKQRLESSTPENFQRVIDVCIAFADPVINGDASYRIWNTDKWRALSLP